MKALVLAAFGAVCFVSSAAIAQDAPVVASAPAVLTVQKAAVGSSLPSNTEIWLSFDHVLSSKKTKEGQQFDVTVSRDVMLGDYVVIPRGAHGHGKIAYRTGKGAFGKSAKMEFDLTDVAVGSRTIPVTGHYRVEGNGNTGAAVGAAVAVGVFGAFVTGHSATVDQGSEWKAYTKEPIMLAFAPTNPPASDAPVVAPVAAVSPVTAPVVTPAPLVATPATTSTDKAPATPAK
jgi:hypothetical protein